MISIVMLEILIHKLVSNVRYNKVGHANYKKMVFQYVSQIVDIQAE